MKIRLVLVFAVLALFMSSCNTPFAKNIKERELDRSYSMIKMEVVDPVAPVQSLYFVRAVFVRIKDDQVSQPVQGVKIQWTYQGGTYVTTFPMNKVRWEVDTSLDVPSFKVDWDGDFMTREVLGTYDDLFQYGGAFNPNDLFGDQQYYSQIVMRMNQVDYDLAMSYIFK